MSYHDIALLSSACNKFIPNEKILDSPNNYNIFGCQKIIGGIDIILPLTNLE